MPTTVPIQNVPKALILALNRKRASPQIRTAALELVTQAAAHIDHKVQQQSLRLLRKSIRAVRSALPETDPKLIGGFFANLLDLWETGQKLDRELKNLGALRFPQDREQLKNILVWIEAIQVDMGSYWIDEVKKDLPKLYKALYRMERDDRFAKRKK